ncbi:hypothetical protein HZH68_000047 [Vespula germanica]|uniref:Uncharacterized protein n=1 Tax=Vespula germanica TaxID=30212 RepID=A0A834U5C8_VESGE|nr:hypothetical protein HZH68_000047 [Vespula germanica]
MYIMRRTLVTRSLNKNRCTYLKFIIKGQNTYLCDLFYRPKAINHKRTRIVRINDTNFCTNCVSKGKLEESKIVKCMNCGCRGCSG